MVNTSYGELPNIVQAAAAGGTVSPRFRSSILIAGTSSFGSPGVFLILKAYRAQLNKRKSGRYSLLPLQFRDQTVPLDRVGTECPDKGHVLCKYTQIAWCAARAKLVELPGRAYGNFKNESVIKFIDFALRTMQFCKVSISASKTCGKRIALLQLTDIARRCQ